MTDPFQGRAPSKSAPFDNCLTVTPDDDADLPIIPSAVYVPLWSKNQDGQPIQNGLPNRPNFLMIEAQNGQTLEMHVPPLNDMLASGPIILPVRPRKILRSGTTLAQIALLW